MQEVVALMDVPDGEHMLFQNLQIVASIQGNVLREEEKAPSAVISAENTPYHYTLWVFHRITVNLESLLDDPCDLLTNLDPPLSSLNVLSFEIITIFQSADIQLQCRYSLQNWSSSWVKLGRAS